MVSHLGISFQQHFYPRNTHCLVYPYHWSVLTSRSDLCLHSCVCHEKDMKSVVCLLIFIPAKTPLGAPNWCGRRLESHCFAYHRKFNKVSCMGNFKCSGADREQPTWPLQRAKAHTNQVNNGSATVPGRHSYQLYTTQSKEGARE